MTLAIIIFFVSLIGIFLMLSYKAWHIRSSNLKEETTGPELHHEILFLHRKVFRITKKAGHLVIIKTLQGWAWVSYKTQKKFKENFPKINYLLGGEKENSQVGDMPKSSFLSAVAEYKTKLKKFRQKIVEKDKANGSKKQEG